MCVYTEHQWWQGDRDAGKALVVASSWLSLIPIQEPICNTKGDNTAALDGKKACKSALSECKNAQVVILRPLYRLTTSQGQSAGAIFQCKEGPESSQTCEPCEQGEGCPGKKSLTRPQDYLAFPQQVKFVALQPRSCLLKVLLVSEA